MPGPLWLESEVSSRKNCCSVANGGACKVINIFRSERIFEGHLAKLPCHSQASRSRLALDGRSPTLSEQPAPVLGSKCANVPTLSCGSVPFPRRCPQALLVCASRGSPVPSYFSLSRKQLRTAQTAQAPSTKHPVSEHPTRHSSPFGHWAYSRHLKSTALRKSWAGLWNANALGDMAGAGRDPFFMPPWLQPWSHSPASRCLATPPQESSQLLAPTLVQSLYSTSDFPPLTVHLQGLLLPRACCGMAFGQPVVGFCPSPSLACQSLLEGWHAVCCLRVSVVPLALRFRDAAPVEITETLQEGFVLVLHLQHLPDDSHSSLSPHKIV